MRKQLHPPAHAVRMPACSLTDRSDYPKRPRQMLPLLQVQDCHV